MRDEADAGEPLVAPLAGAAWPLLGAPSSTKATCQGQQHSTFLLWTPARCGLAWVYLFRHAAQETRLTP